VRIDKQENRNTKGGWEKKRDRPKPSGSAGKEKETFRLPTTTGRRRPKNSYHEELREQSVSLGLPNENKGDGG